MICFGVNCNYARSSRADTRTVSATQIHLYLMTHKLAVVVAAAGARPTRWSTAEAAAATAHKQPHNDLVTQLSTVSTRSNARATTTATCTTTTATCNNNKLRGEEINSLATIYSTRIDGHKLERLAHFTRERRESAQECRLCKREKEIGEGRDRGRKCRSSRGKQT